MIYAHNHLGEKIEAYPGATGWCPLCTSPLIAKCGDINIHHWAHSVESSTSCIHEKETEWHIEWKDLFHRDYREIVVTNQYTGVKKIADICELSGLVIEFQHSAISPEEISIREAHYKNMIWVFDLRDAYDSDRLKYDDKYGTFFWYRSKRTILGCKKDFYFDLGNSTLIRPHNIFETNGGHRGSACKISKPDFIWENSSMSFHQYSKLFSV